MMDDCMIAIISENMGTYTHPDIWSREKSLWLPNLFIEWIIQDGMFWPYALHI